jgi:hypothetical protein
MNDERLSEKAAFFSLDFAGRRSRQKTIARCEASGAEQRMSRTEGAGDRLPPLQGGFGLSRLYQTLRIWLLSLGRSAAVANRALSLGVKKRRLF